MKEASIEEIAYLIRSAKENNLPKPIVFLGAGASASGGIPLAGEIVKDIRAKYPYNPKLKKLPKEEQRYSKLMDCLLPSERNRILKEYIDRAKINVAHIYLAHLITENCVDYVLTVNFDNLMLRALALFNYFPPTYDLAVLKALTTTNLHEKSVVYLHGQHHGLWLLNTQEEMQSVHQIIPPILNKIANQRPWIVIGYSGVDPIFNHIIDLGRFDNGMFWVCYKDQIPEEKICTNLLNKANTNASIIKGYDADTFMMSLNNELHLGEPFILDKPFSFLDEAVDNIVENYEKKEYSSVQKRLKITKKHINLAIQQFEKGIVIKTKEVGEDLITDQLKREIINRIIQKDFKGLEEYRELVSKSEDKDLKVQLADLYYGAAVAVFDQVGDKPKEEAIPLFHEAIEQLKISISLDANSEKVYNEMAFVLIGLSERMDREEQEKLVAQAIAACKKAIEVNEQSEVAYYNWGVALDDLSKNRKGEEKRKLIVESISRYEKSLEFKDDYHIAHNNLGVSYMELAKLSPFEDQAHLYRKSELKFKRALKLHPEYPDYYLNTGFALLELVRYKETGKEELILEAIDYCEEGIKLDGENFNLYYCLSRAYFLMGSEKKGEEKKYYYEKAITAANQSISFNDKFSASYHNLASSLQELARLEPEGKAVGLFEQSIVNYNKAIALNPEESSIHEDCSAAYLELAKRKTGVEQVNLFFECEKHVLRVKELDGRVYNLSCFYAIREMKAEAMKELKVALENKEVPASYVREDSDWAKFYEDPDFDTLLKQFE